MTASPPAPPSSLRRISAVVERNMLVGRRLWLVVLSGLVEPVLFLLALGVGLGSLIGDVTSAGGRAVPYASFVAPALLAASAMNGALYECNNVFNKLKYQRVYAAMLATPLGPRQIVLGEIVGTQLRGALYAVLFLAVMLFTGTVDSAWGLLALPAAVLAGLSFAAAGIAVTTFLRTWKDQEFITVAQIAMLLFAATFFPVSVYPDALGAVVRVLPLYHASELLRDLTLGELSDGTLLHLGYVLALLAVGALVAVRRLGRLFDG